VTFVVLSFLRYNRQIDKTTKSTKRTKIIHQLFIFNRIIRSFFFVFFVNFVVMNFPG